MTGKGEKRLKIVMSVTTNLLGTINEVDKEDEENVMTSASPKQSDSPPPHGSVTASHEKGASTSTTEEVSSAVKKLLEAWLISTLNSILDKPLKGRVGTPHELTPQQQSTSNTLLPTGNTHTVVDAGNYALAAILRKMKKMENENKALRNQMREHQERVDKIPGAPKFLPKWDVGRFMEQPYNKEAAPHSIPKTFKMPPYLKICDITTDPEDHIIHYVTVVKRNDLLKEQVPSVLLKKFSETLTGGALTWYSQLPACSIMTFEEMADKFVTTHAGAKKEEARVNDIFAIKQSPGERLRDFLARFNRVRMSLPNASEGMAVAAFQNELNRNRSRATRKLLSRLMKYPPTTWEEIHNAYYAEVRANKDDLNGLTQ
ncbi:uncharacterized protein [Nicotiana sylvestris]|uniref:uncharacterized protein n=1 Tax=Nicotiana sylvestris TaxID=4096 RepID=UPI00388C46E1